MKQKTIKCGKISISNSETFTLIAGPCLLENEKLAVNVATQLKEITQKLNIPTIGIGAGLMCDGQIQVLHDIIGLFGEETPKHAHTYINTKQLITENLKQYQEDVLNKQVMILVNLKPRKMMGIESQGMLLLRRSSQRSLR